MCTIFAQMLALVMFLPSVCFCCELDSFHCGVWRARSTAIEFIVYNRAMWNHALPCD